MAGEEILIVEDNPTNLKLVKILLTAEKYLVRTAVDAVDALKVLSACHPRLILMDIQLPGKNGLELTQELKSDPRYKDIIIVALTAYAMKGDEDKARAAGCDGYMIKPISTTTFPKDIERFLTQNIGKTEEQEELPTPPKVLIVEDNPISCKVLRISLEREHYTVVVAMNGASALQEVEKQQFDLIIQDLFLPDMDGFILNKKLRELPGGQNIPIFALSGFLSHPNITSEHSGFTTFLLKPIDSSFLMDVVKAYLPISKSSDSLVGKGKHVLIADDNVIQLKLFNMQLKNAGFKVTTALDGIIALKEVRLNPPDIIVSDILMPNMDGFNLCLEIKRDPKLNAIPVILLTSHYLEDEDLALAKNVGASCYLTRTPDEEKLIGEILKNLNTKSPISPIDSFELAEDIKEKHTIRSIKQLEQQVLDNAKLAQRCARLVSQLSLIAGIANTLTSSSIDIDESLKEILYFCLDVAGLSKGALYIKKSNNNMELKQQLGFINIAKKKFDQFSGLSILITEIINNHQPIVIPSQQCSSLEAKKFLDETQIKSAVLIPLISGEECLGILFLGSDKTNLSGEITSEFIGTLGVQLGQSIALASSFDKLSSSEKRYRQLVEISPNAIFILQKDKFVYANLSALKLLNAKNNEELLTHSLDQFFLPDYQKIIKDNLDTNTEQPYLKLPEGKIIDLQGEMLDVEIVVSHFFYQEKPAIYMIMSDISERVRSELHLEIQYAIAWVLAESASLYVATIKILKIVCERLEWECGTIWAVDSKANLLRCSRVWHINQLQNEAFEAESKQMTCAMGVELPGQVWKERKAIWKADLSQDALFNRKQSCSKIGLKTAVAFPIIYENEVLGVIEFFSNHIIQPKYDLLLWFESIGNQFGLFLKRKHMEKQMLYLAEHDALTGLSNRNLLEQYLYTAIETAKETGQQLTVLFLDLDHFKYVNDSLGHQSGDLLLKKIAARLLICLRPQDIVSRLGGDEFVIILNNIHEEEDIIEIIGRIRQQLSTNFILKEKEYLITTSIGISRYPENGDTVQKLIKGADIAMYAAKEQGRNNYQFCTNKMTEKAEFRGVLQSNLRNALENDEFILFYQPKIDVISQKIVGMEGLIRWQKPEGIILPGQFISAIENSDLIVSVSAWVLRTACIQNKLWQDLHLPNITMSVNLSVRNLNPQLLLTVEKILAETNLDPQFVEIELTESVLMVNVENNILILRSLKEMGLKISIDDFGTGYSSLSYLKRFPIDVIKIDQSFVSDIETVPSGTAIVTAIIAMAHSLDFKVIAEGVETHAQLKFLCEHGCDEIQGYYFSRPLDVTDATDFLKNAKIAWSLK